MATITKTQSDTWKVQVRKIGLPVVSKTFKTKQDAEVWSRSVESDQDRGVFVNRSEADMVLILWLLLALISPQQKQSGLNPFFERACNSKRYLTALFNASNEPASRRRSAIQAALAT
jgi:hypothetical protein